jgi:hypothetical protein
MSRLRILTLLITLLAIRFAVAQTSPPVELPESREAQLVTLRLTHADGQRVGFAAPLKVQTTASFEGEVTNLPLGASVWLAVRDGQVRDPQWRILFPAATADESGHWQDRVDVPCGNGRATCEVMAFVSNRVLEQGSHDDGWFRRNAYKRTESVEIQLLPAVQGRTAGSVRIATIADTPADAAQPIVTPSTFGIDGSSEQLAQGTPVWALAQCTPSKTWDVLGQTTTATDGTWRMSQLTLPPIQGTGHRACAIQVFGGSSSPPEHAAESTIAHWAALESARLQIIRNPYFLTIASITDITGKRLQSNSTSTSVTISAAAASMEVEADQLPPDVRVWQLLRCDGCGNWLAFGPAELLESGRYLIVHPRFRFPARPLATRYVSMAIASRENLEGMALTPSDIARKAVGISRIMPVDLSAAAKTGGASVSLLSINGEPIDAKSVTRLGSDDLLTVICKSGALAPNQGVYIGYRDPPSGRWLFRGATQAGETYRVLAAVPPVDVAPQEGANSALIPVLAESLPTDHLIDEEWWREMTTAIGETAPLSLPSLPWFRRAGSRLRATVATISTLGIADNDDPAAQALEVSMNWSNLVTLLLLLFGSVLTLLLIMWAWRHRTGARVVLNARLDARTRRGTSSFGSQPFERVIQARTDANMLAIQKKTTTRIAKHRGELSACEDQLSTTYEPEYERLKTKTGRHDASVALGSTAHRTLLVVLTVGESAFNLAVFYVFREPAVYTLLMALAIAVAIPICAFSVGLWIRRWQSPWVGTAFKLLTTTCVLGLALVGLNHVRMAHLSTVAPAFVRDHPELNTAFLSFNAMIFLAAAMVTYWAHDPEENFAEAKHNIERLRKRAARLHSSITVLEDQLRSDIEQEKEHGKYYAALYRTVFERRSRPADTRSEATATS